MKTTIIIISFLLVGFSATAQDVITLKNGEDIQAIVQEINEVDIKYKKFDNPNGPNYTLKKSEILMIRYANGSKDVFADIVAPVVESTPTPTPTIKRQHQIEIPPNPLSVQGTKNKIFDNFGVQLSKQDVRNVMKNVPEALNLYNSGKNLRGDGTVFTYVSIGCCAMALFQTTKSWGTSYTTDEELKQIKKEGRKGWYWLGGALVSNIISRRCLSSGNNKIKESVAVYNNEIGQKQTSDVSMNFGITQSGGIGLTINF